MLKQYILDSSVLLSAPSAIYAFEDNNVLIPVSVIGEIGEKTKAGGELRSNAMEALKLLDSVYHAADGAVQLHTGGLLKIIGTQDDSIYSLAEKESATIVSRSAAVRLTARSMSLNAEPFKAEQLANNCRPYEGRCNLFVSGKEMSDFSSEKQLILDESKAYYATDTDNQIISTNHKLSPNEYVTLVNSECPDRGTMLGRFDGEKIVPLLFYSKKHPVFGVTARNAAQMFALDALMNPNAPLVILQGPAGTAKTFLSMAAALEQTYAGDRYRRILITRPNAKMDADVGFLKGDERQKVMPTLRGLLDNLNNLMPPDEQSRKKDGCSCGTPMDTLLETGVLEPQAMAYMRGRSICKQFIIVDEMQNSTINQVLSIITRVGEESKIVLLGDPNQIDNPYLDFSSNGLVYAAEHMRQSRICSRHSLSGFKGMQPLW